MLWPIDGQMKPLSITAKRIQIDVSPAGSSMGFGLNAGMPSSWSQHRTACPAGGLASV